MGIFDGIENAEVFNSSVNIRPGQHQLKIRELLVQKSRKKAGVQFFIAEMEVVGSEGGRPSSAKTADAPLSHPHRTGETVSWVVDMTQESALNNVKGFALALDADAKNEDITPAQMDALVSSDQPAKGIIVNASALMVLTRAGGDFTKINWTAARAA
jgi:hypothetical protein